MKMPMQAQSIKTSLCFFINNERKKGADIFKKGLQQISTYTLTVCILRSTWPVFFISVVWFLALFVLYVRDVLLIVKMAVMKENYLSYRKTGGVIHACYLGAFTTD